METEITGDNSNKDVQLEEISSTGPGRRRHAGGQDGVMRGWGGFAVASRRFRRVA
jgi:hypothetical protein